MANDSQDTGQQAMEGANTLTPRTSKLIDIRNTLYQKLDLATTRAAEGIYLAERTNETGFCLVFTSGHIMDIGNDVLDGSQIAWLQGRFETITSDPKTLLLREREVVAKATMTVPQAIKTLIAETKASRAHSEEQFRVFGEKIEQVGDKIARAIAEAFKGLSVPPPTAPLTAPTPATTVSVETLTSRTPSSTNVRISPAARADSENPVRAARAGTAGQPTEVARDIDNNAPPARQSCRRPDPVVDARAAQALSWRRQSDELLRQSIRASNRWRGDSSSVEDGELPDDEEDWDAENEVSRERTSARSSGFARTRLSYDETVSRSEQHSPQRQGAFSSTPRPQVGPKKVANDGQKALLAQKGRDDRGLPEVGKNQCHTCGLQGHWKSQCPNEGRKFCFHCGSPNHLASQCSSQVNQQRKRAADGRHDDSGVPEKKPRPSPTQPGSSGLASRGRGGRGRGAPRRGGLPARYTPGEYSIDNSRYFATEEEHQRLLRESEERRRANSQLDDEYSRAYDYPVEPEAPPEHRPGWAGGYEVTEYVEQETYTEETYDDGYY